MARRSRFRRSPPFIFKALAATGIALLIWAGWQWFLPGPAPYSYALVDEGGLADFPDLGLDGPEDLAVRRYELLAEGAAGAQALVHVGMPADGAAPVLLGWQNLGAEPLLAFGVRSQDLNALAQAVTANIATDATVLAWWDTSRQLEYLSGRTVVFDENLGEPLLVPDAWASRHDSIVALEQHFWTVSRAGAPRFDRFLDALMADPRTGAAELRALAGDKPAFVVVHLSDAFRLGAMRPGRFGVGYRDFAGGGDVHTEIRMVKNWLTENGYTSYAVERLSLLVTRVHFLTDAASEGTLLAAMLPFTSSNPLTLESLGLVANYGGYWVFEVSANATDPAG